jgi:hypothetical protein
MIESKNAAANTVKAYGQVDVNKYVSIFNRGGVKKVMFFGNSITRHEPNASIGWHGDWGMAASSIDKDYVHQTVRMLEERYGKVQFCIAQRADWERDFSNPRAIDYFKEAYEFDADIAIFRLGENVRLTSPEQIDVLAGAFVNAMKYLTENRRAKLVVTDTFWRNGGVNAAIEQACQRMGLESVKLGDLGDDDLMKALDKFEHGGVKIHPGDNGMKAIADRIVAKIDEIM